ncbi:MAG: hypothetical protein KatS3mg103_0003 [Phycisphaerales bacterium]|nr:MAG: hypothetical protein KatS3mg103_0003 [Phycisphaerales bacterium]
MAERTGVCGGRVVVCRVAAAGLVVALAGGLIGCDQQDPASQAIVQGSIELRAISPGSVPPVGDQFAVDRYRAVASEVTPAMQAGSAGQKAAAALLLAQAQAGQARPALSRLVEIEHRIAEALNRMRSLETARVMAEQTAQALASFDPSQERSAIETRTGQLQRQLAEAQAQRQALEDELAELGRQIESLESQIGSIRAQESSLRDRALREGPIEAAATIEQARQEGRRADALEVQASTLDAPPGGDPPADPGPGCPH